MELPPRSATLDEGRDQLHQRYAQLEKLILDDIDMLAKAGFSDKRWCAIARTRIEEGFLALHRALRDYPGDDPNDYGKNPYHQPMPRQFAPSPEPNPRSHIDGNRPVIEDYRADGGSTKPE